MGRVRGSGRLRGVFWQLGSVLGNLGGVLGEVTGHLVTRDQLVQRRLHRPADVLRLPAPGVEAARRRGRQGARHVAFQPDPLAPFPLARRAAERLGYGNRRQQRHRIRVPGPGVQLVPAGHLDDLAEFSDVVSQMSEMGRQFLPVAAEAAAEVTSLGCTRACFVGSGVLRAVADESALKVVELSAGKVTTLAETPLGLRHGPLSSVDGQTIFVGFLSSEARRRGYELDLLREIDRKRLGRVRIAVTTGDGADASQLADYVLPVGSNVNFPDLHRPVLDVMLGQLLGLFTSMRCGLKPDQPSPNGAITRVVQPIKLYS